MTEHQAAVRRGDTNNGIAVHAWSEGHQVDWEGAKVIAVAPNLWKRKVVEALLIQSTTPNMNLDCGLLGTLCSPGYI